MKSDSSSFHGRRRAVLVILVSARLAGALFAQQSVSSIEVTPGITLSLPASWKIIDRSSEVRPAQPMKSGSEMQGVTLLLTARPVDIRRTASISLFRMNSGGVGQAGLPNEMRSQLETERVLQGVLSQGFSPMTTRLSQTSTRGMPQLTIEVTAKTAFGEERLFTDTVTAQRSATLRLCSSRALNDQVSAQEIAAVVQSLIVREDVASPTRPFPGVASNPGITGGSPSSPPSSAPPATAPFETSTEAAQIVRDYHAALILVEGQKGVGSGFLCTLEGKTIAVTNAHVLSDNFGVKLTNLDGTALTAGPSAIAVGHDIVKLEIADAPKAFAIMPDLDNNVRIGDAVIVPGNAEGARVVKPVEGKIVGIGPDLIEVDAPFVRGNSGSPIIHRATGKVLGIATYLVQRRVDQETGGAVQVQTRRFGYRLDSVRQWEPINWPRFFLQSAQVAKMEALSEDFVKMFEEARATNRFDPHSYTSPLMQHAIQTFITTANKGGKSMSSVDRKEMLRRLFADLRGATRSDINAFDARTAHDYFRRKVDDQSRFRDELYKVFTQLMESRPN
jgi:hypothetical protein